MGKPSPGYHVVLVDRDDSICNVGEEGEIVIRTDGVRPPGLFIDYHLDPERMRDTWYDDYLHTGETAWIDEDGYLRFVGTKPRQEGDRTRQGSPYHRVRRGPPQDDQRQDKEDRDKREGRGLGRLISNKFIYLD
ncbi:AMP-binding protein [Methanotrichaceae archaeon Mx]|uniref:AMP-binding protein n=1 Tax=Candidatus Methanocrinis natronophilus TaxID=3033396 RepID=A0ABT5X802_9EURY|nr:AMP-binding protein [Candidatus Methanocrinis natronophilus]